MNELHIFPNNIVLIDTGHVINLSKVFLIVSQGKTIGPIEVEVKKIIIAIKPDINKMGWIVLPSVNAINRIAGKRIP